MPARNNNQSFVHSESKQQQVEAPGRGRQGRLPITYAGKLEPIFAHTHRTDPRFGDCRLHLGGSINQLPAEQQERTRGLSGARRGCHNCREQARVAAGVLLSRCFAAVSSGRVVSDGDEAQPPEAEQDKGAWFLFWWQSPTPGQQVNTRTARQAGRALLLLFVVFYFYRAGRLQDVFFFLLCILWHFIFRFKEQERFPDQD